ncbi:hypothetical protein ABT294_06850 [Nonomuraea sp. NPDC000554]|uniref:hypothetical protein n=1 Tax=Nonomuraea sp. NPDC000554 TaxID=3154259 RepID=UPI0033224D9F
MNKSTVAAIVGASLMAGLLGLGASSASASDEAHQPRPPKGARAVVQVSPNPTAKRGEEITITGNCGGGKKLNAVIGGIGGESILENVRIVNDDPKGFVAKANLAETIGNGVGPIFVDCGGEAGVTLLVTHV